jgi:hypothetical protein
MKMKIIFFMSSSSSNGEGHDRVSISSHTFSMSFSGREVYLCLILMRRVLMPWAIIVMENHFGITMHFMMMVNESLFNERK